MKILQTYIAVFGICLAVGLVAYVGYAMAMGMAITATSVAIGSSALASIGMSCIIVTNSVQSLVERKQESKRQLVHEPAHAL